MASPDGRPDPAALGCDAKSSAMMFRHEPLVDSKACIRLLRLKAGTELGDMVFELRTWQTNEAPSYNAISYTWGENVTRTIQVNGQILEIRRNCHEALRQAISYDPKVRLWIDSICIDQENIIEKSQQVQNMYNIFRNAANVLACIGGHADGSEQLHHFCKLVLGAGDHPALISEGPSPKFLDFDLPEVALAFESNHQDVIAEMRRSIIAFAQRPYWNRLWIVQEILAGAQTVRVIFGNQLITWWQLSTLVEVVLMWTTTPGQGVGQTPLRRLMHIKEMSELYGGTVRFSQLLQWLSGTGCTDPRDRIFGLVAIVDWKNVAMDPIIPDYTQTAWSLAVKLTVGFGAQSCGPIMKMLAINFDAIEIQNLVREREISRSLQCIDAEVQEFAFGEVTATCLSDCGHGELCVQNETRSRPRWEDPTLPVFQELVSSSKPELHVSKPRKIICNSRTVALICSEALPGDFLLTSLAWKRMCFICRQTQGDRMDVVGTGIVFGNMNEATLSSPHTGILQNETHKDLGSNPRADFYLSATPEDVMLFFRADFMTENVWIDICVEMSRFMSRPILAPKGAARLTACKSQSTHLSEPNQRTSLK